MIISFLNSYIYMNMLKKKNNFQIRIDRCLKWFVITIILSFHNCVARTDCSDKNRIAVIMNLKSEVCKSILQKHDLPSNEDHHFLFKINHVMNERNIEINIFDSCGIKEETARLVFEVISWSNLNCLRPPYFLGFIGPEDIGSIEAASKITSPLRIPHITSIQTTLPYTHYFNSDQELLLIEAAYKLMSELGWKSFILKGNVKRTVERRIMQEFVEKSSQQNFCILPTSEVSAPIIYIGNVDSNYFNSIHNSTVLIIGGQNVEKKLDNLHSKNLILLITDSRKLRESSTNYIQSWDSSFTELNLDLESSMFMLDAVNVYSRALTHLCESENCYTPIDSGKWNDYVVQALSTDDNIKSIRYVLKVKDHNDSFKQVGKIMNYKNNMEIHWSNDSSTSHDSFNIDKVVEKFKEKAKHKNQATCIAYGEVFGHNLIDSFDQHKANTIIVSEVTDAEWWTMVGTVAGVGIAMFTVGFFAVYVVYTNIRGPQHSKPCGKSNFEHDSSLRRVGSDKQISTTSNRNSRFPIGIQRKDSRSSIRSNISDKSV